jgi:protein TonB
MKFPIAVLLLALATAAGCTEAPSTDMPAISPLFPRFAFKPQVEDYYPSASRSLKEQGTTTIRLCYDEQGRTNQVTMVESSGFSRLDEAAVRWGKAVRVTPGIDRGQPQPDCHKIPVKFSLEKEKSQEPADPRWELVLPPGEAAPPPPVIIVPPPLWGPAEPIPLAPSLPEKSIPL